MSESWFFFCLEPAAGVFGGQRRVPDRGESGHPLQQKQGGYRHPARGEEAQSQGKTRR